MKQADREVRPTYGVFGCVWEFDSDLPDGVSRLGMGCRGGMGLPERRGIFEGWLVVFGEGFAVGGEFEEFAAGVD